MLRAKIHVGKNGYRFLLLDSRGKRRMETKELSFAEMLIKAFIFYGGDKEGVLVNLTELFPNGNKEALKNIVRDSHKLYIMAEYMIDNTPYQQKEIDFLKNHFESMIEDHLHEI